MEVNLELATSDPTLESSLLQGTDGEVGSKIEIAHETVLRFEGRENYLDLGAQELLLFALSMPIGVATSMIAAALYDFLTKRKHQIDRVRLECTATLEGAQAGSKRRKRMVWEIDLHQSDAEIVSQIASILGQCQDMSQ